MVHILVQFLRPQSMKFSVSLLLGALTLNAHAQTELFSYPDFTVQPELALQGSARVATDRILLGSGVATNGGIWYPAKRFLQEGFDSSFRFHMPNGGEGIAFVVQNNALPALGRAGSGLGLEGVPNSVAVEIDALSSGDITDLVGSHVSVQSRGGQANFAGASASQASAGIATLSTAVHSVRVRYTPGTLEVFLNNPNTPVLSMPLVLTNLLSLDRGQAWFGIVAPGDTEVLSWSFSLAATPLTVSLLSPLQGASFVSPGAVDLEAEAAGPDAIQKVEFFSDSTLLFTDSEAPYRLRWQGLLPGPYLITAVATDAVGRRVTSAPANILVYPSEPGIAVNFATAPAGTNYVMKGREKAGVIPQYYWNNASMLTNGNGTLPNLRDASGNVTPMDMNFDFDTYGEEPRVDARLSPDHRLMRAFGLNIPAAQSNVLVQFSAIPYPIYDVIVYTDGANGGADRVGQFRVTGGNAFVRDAAWTTFAGIYARAAGTADNGVNTPAGNYVRFNGLTTVNFTITNAVRFASDGQTYSAINAIQIVPSAYDPNSPVFSTRGPYLQMGTTNSVMVRWRSNRPTTSRVQYGTNVSNLEFTMLLAGERQEHAVTLTNLQPNTQYFYAVGNVDTNFVRGTNIHFWTAPTTPKPTRIWALGDSGTADSRPASVRNAFYAFNGNRYVDVWLMLGDNAYNSGTDAEFQSAVFNMWTNTLPTTTLWSCIGNHETAQSHTPVSTTPYLAIHTFPQNGEAGGVPSGTERYYSFDYSDIHFLVLDSMTSDRSANGPMANWMRADLEANTKNWIIALFHHPPYTKGSHDSDDPNGADFELVEMRQNFVPIMEDYGVDLVLSGHSHIYERSYLLKGHYGFSTNLQPSMILDSGSGNPESEDDFAYQKTTDGTVYIVNGSSGQATFTTGVHPAMYTSILQLGSVVIDIDGNTLVERFIRETGEVQDTFTIIKNLPESPQQLRITSSTLVSGALSLSWQSRPGSRYVVERAADLSGRRWQAVSEPITARSSSLSWTHPFGAHAPAAFYRVVNID